MFAFTVCRERDISKSIITFSRFSKSRRCFKRKLVNTKNDFLFIQNLVTVCSLRLSRVFKGLENCEQKLFQSLKRCFRTWSLYSCIHHGRGSFHIPIIERQISHISRIILVITSKLSACLWRSDWEPSSTILLHGTTSFAVPWQNEIWNITLLRSTGFERTLLMLRFSCLIFVRCCSSFTILNEGLGLA